MVVINLTLFIILGMFGVFLWAMNAFVFRPLLEVMDKREDKLAEDEARATSEGKAAGQIEQAYAAKVAALHREETRKVRQAHWEAQNAHNARVAELKDQENEELEALRLECLRQIDAQRDNYPPLVKDLAGRTAQHLGLQGGQE